MAHKLRSLLHRPDPEYTRHVQILAMSHFARYRLSHQNKDLDKSILYHTEAIILLHIQAEPVLNAIETLFHLTLALLE